MDAVTDEAVIEPSRTGLLPAGNVMVYLALTPPAKRRAITARRLEATFNSVTFTKLLMTFGVASAMAPSTIPFEPSASTNF